MADSYYPKHAGGLIYDRLEAALAEVIRLREVSDTSRAENALLRAENDRLDAETKVLQARIAELTKALMRFES